MRDVAAKVRNVFGLDKFSHSTVSRSLKQLAGIVQDLGLISAQIEAYNTTGTLKAVAIFIHRTNVCYVNPLYILGFKGGTLIHSAKSKNYLHTLDPLKLCVCNSSINISQSLDLKLFYLCP